MKNIILCIFLNILISSCLYCSEVFIIVHGTWGATSNWNKPGGDFFNSVQQTAERLGATVTTFTWSGKLNNKSRRTAAFELTQLIESYPPDTVINLITHSHGGNVGILASQELAKNPHNKHSINAFYAMATPVNAREYMPAMNIIKRFYNLFSCDDPIQPVLGFFGRIYPEHSNIANIRVLIDGKGPDHKEFHTPILGAWLPLLHEQLAADVKGNFQCFEFTKPGLIYFWSTNDLPYYCTDHEREELLEKDAHMMRQLVRMFIRKKALQ